MFLKNLTLKGFKSFASATSLDLEPGVTVVVGPNGSGKSNVVDAIAWVLGAQSPKSVRSQKMDDVIFAGTTRKSALGRAEVSLTIDNSARVLPIDFEEVTITRVLFRSGDSEYSINGVNCRLLDIQDLLSDTGVGRQQHVIVSQGQIDAVLNARPEDRRAIIEEAAGVLKYRRRKEKAERRLNATEANLTRLQDLLREVRRQLKPLERQAEAARRHGDLVGELSQLRLHVAGREIAELKTRQQRSSEQRQTFERRQAELTTQLAGLDTEVLAAEARLSAAGVDDTSDVLIRCEALRERIRGLERVLEERIRGLDRERESSVDGAVRSTLEADLGQIRQELADVEIRATELGTDEAKVVTAEQEIASARADFEQAWGDTVPELSDQTAQVRGELTARRQAADQTRAERSRLAARGEELRTQAQNLQRQGDELRDQLRELEHAELALVGRVDEIAERHETSVTQVAEAKASHDELTAEHQRWAARSDALSLALDELRSGSEALTSLDGVLAPLVELVDVDDEWAEAFAAAVAEGAGAVVVESPAAARAALTHLQSDDAAGALHVLGLDPGPVVGPAVGAALRPHVRGSTPSVDALLDRLIGHFGVVDTWQDAVDACLADPRVSLVTRDGGRFGPSQWLFGGDRQAVTGNALEEARTRVVTLEAELVAARTKLDELRSAHAAIESEQARLAEQLNNSDDASVTATEKLSTILRTERDLHVESETVDARMLELDTRLGDADGRLNELATRLGALEADDAQQLEQGQLRDAALAQMTQRTASVAQMRADLDIRTSAIAEQRAFLATRQTDVTGRLERHIQADEATDAWTIDDRHAVVSALREMVVAQTRRVEGWLGEARAERARQTEQVQAVARQLDGLRQARSSAERSLAEVRERSSRSEIEAAEVAVRLEAVVEAVRRDLDCEPAVAVAAVCPPLPEGIKPAARLRELERELRIMGPVNPLALEEFEALRERFDFLTEQLDDVKGSRRELNKVIRAIDEEIVNVFASAYADVADNFERLFGTLFPGGQGKLRLTEPNDMLNSGIEVSARPSGKNVRKLSLLSGGERSLTALAFLFGVFRSRPSPFYVMDEVEAALDDVNLHRFLDLVAEFRDEAQLIIVSHQKRTMEAADCLFGITMEPGGSSRAVSEKPGADMTRYVDPPAAGSQSVPEPSVGS